MFDAKQRIDEATKFTPPGSFFNIDKDAFEITKSSNARYPVGGVVFSKEFLPDGVRARKNKSKDYYYFCVKTNSSTIPVLACSINPSNGMRYNTFNFRKQDREVITVKNANDAVFAAGKKTNLLDFPDAAKMLNNFRSKIVTLQKAVKDAAKNVVDQVGDVAEAAAGGPRKGRKPRRRNTKTTWRQ